MNFKTKIPMKLQIIAALLNCVISLFTSYSWPCNVMKPILNPLMNSVGTEITRG